MRSSGKLAVVRGAGDLASGVIHARTVSGWRVIARETAQPGSSRRAISFSEAVYDGQMTVEGVTARLAETADEALRIAADGFPAILVDPDCESLNALQPDVLIDAVIAKRNLGTHRGMAPLTIALGPGFEAGKDADYVIETMRGPDLGRAIRDGYAIADTGVPGLVAGYAEERVIHAPASGTLHAIHAIGDRVRKGEMIADILCPDGSRMPVQAGLDGLLRGLIRDGFPVRKGLKIADIEPRADQPELCFRISDKSRCIARSVMAILAE